MHSNRIQVKSAENAVTAARNALATAAPVPAADPGAERLAAVLGGSIFLATGSGAAAPRRRNGLNFEPVAKRSPAAATPPKRGTAAYYVARLHRDHPTIAVSVAAGELSVYKACIAAGISKAPAKTSKWSKPDAYMRTASATA